MRDNGADVVGAPPSSATTDRSGLPPISRAESDVLWIKPLSDRDVPKSRIVATGGARAIGWQHSKKNRCRCIPGRERHETSTQNISAFGRGRCCPTGRVAHREGPSLSVSAGPPRRRFSAGRASTIARLIGQVVGPTWSAFVIENRPGGGGNHRHRGGRALPPDGYTLLACRYDERDQRDALREAQLLFHPRHRPVASILRAPQCCW